MTTLVIALLTLLVGLACGVLLGSGLLRGRRTDLGAQVQATASATQQAVAPVRESLDRFGSRLRELEGSRIEWHAQLREQVESVRVTGEALRSETASLATALRRPQVRGRWGELHLRRTVELAGLVDRCDFTEQVSLRDGEGALRPDLIVHLAGGRQVVVDAKVPLDAFLDATQASDETVRTQALRRHARQMRAHVDALAGKAYWRHLDPTPEFVVLFVPGDAFLSEALSADTGLLEHAAARQVVLATPSTLIALLRTVALAWREESVAASAREVQALGQQVYERLGTLGGHVDKLGRSLSASVASYNQAVASLEGRVLVTARRMRDLQGADDPLEPPEMVDRTVRPLAAAELIDRPSAQTGHAVRSQPDAATPEGMREPAAEGVEAAVAGKSSRPAGQPGPGLPARRAG
ncbi:MAG: DNA recombination protein RmuC [Actinomycetota bacterium]|nr:DNA recombination protein RmuC [Actinomycetota bacterium]